MDAGNQGQGSGQGQGRGESSSALPSPTDARTPTRFTSMTGGNREGDTILSESFQSTDTVRRRPENYGTITSQGSSQYYGDNSSTPVQDRPQQRPGGTPNIAATRSPLLGPDRGRSRPRKPPLSRRASSNVQAPHRGSVFSVDDAASEVQADEDERQNSYAQPATLRRRGATGTGAPLSRIHSSLDNIEQDDDEEAAAGGPTASTPRTVATPYSSANQSDTGFFDSTGIDADGNVGDDDDDDMERSFMIDRNDIDDDPENDNRGPGHDDDDDDDDLSDAESFTLKDRQQAINETHPFGIRLWKPALYKKDRSVQKTAEGDIHSSPGGHVHNWLLFFNIMWTLCFGMWLSLLCFMGAIVCLLFAALPSGREYGRVLWGLAGYLFYPFGKFVRLEQQEAYLDEDLGEGRSISEYEQWQNGDLEYGRLFFGPERSRSIVGRSRRSFDSTPTETDRLIQHRTSAARYHSRYNRHPNTGNGTDDEYDSDDEIDRYGDDDDAELPRLKRRLFGRGQWNIGRVIFFLFFYLLITPALFIVSGICWFLVFSIPMGRVTFILFDHLRRHPLALTFESDIATARAPAAPQSSIIVCTYRAVGSKYWKYTVDGTNIFLINLMAVVIFVIFDWLVLDGVLHLESVITSSAFLFVAALLSIIPLAYFIGQAVASISAQSSMGVGAAINAFFSTIVEVFLYCVALNQGKSQLVEGSIVGSIFAGVLFLPGLSMCFGAIKRKTQRFNARSAGVTSTMLLFAVIGAFSPTLFYQIYGTHELNCLDCINSGNGVGVGGGDSSDCRRCYFSQTPSIDDRFYLEAVRPYCYVAASLLFLSYAIGLWFTLRTHAAVIWNTEIEEKRHEELAGTVPRHHMNSVSGAAGTTGADATGVDIRDSHLYRRILGQSLKQVGLQPRQDGSASREASVSGPSGGAAPNGGAAAPTSASKAPASADDGRSSVRIAGFTEAESNNLVHQVAEMAATAATIAARDARLPRRTSARGNVPTTGMIGGSSTAGGSTIRTNTVRTAPFNDLYEGGGIGIVPGTGVGAGVGGGGAPEEPAAHAAEAGHGGHDAPNWSRRKSAIILMLATALYAVIAEILVDSVDFVLDGFSIDQKFLGITLFALVPNTTEFLNAISFAMNGNIALSMEIGSAYALQVCLLQIPALVLFSALFPAEASAGVDVSRFTFSLLFPQWDMVTVILCVFLLSYMYGEGKSNYFKGSILLLSYLVVVVGYYFSGYTNLNMGVGTSGLRRFDTLGLDGQYMPYSKSFKTVGRSRMGEAY